MERKGVDSVKPQRPNSFMLVTQVWGTRKERERRLRALGIFRDFQGQMLGGWQTASELEPEASQAGEGRF